MKSQKTLAKETKALLNKCKKKVAKESETKLNDPYYNACVEELANGLRDAQAAVDAERDRINSMTPEGQGKWLVDKHEECIITIEKMTNRMKLESTTDAEGRQFLLAYIMELLNVLENFGIKLDTAAVEYIKGKNTKLYQILRVFNYGA